MLRGMALMLVAAALIPQVKGKDGTFDFKVTPGANGAPCVSYSGPAESGGNCFVVGKVATIHKLRWSKRYHLRFFARRVPRRAIHVPRDNIVALDKRGRLLGRQHWRDKHGGYGRCDGIWDRKHCPT